MLCLSLMAPGVLRGKLPERTPSAVSLLCEVLYKTHMFLYSGLIVVSEEESCQHVTVKKIIIHINEIKLSCERNNPGKRKVTGVRERSVSAGMPSSA